MRTVHGLRIVRGIPVALIKDDSIRGGEVDSEATSARTEQKTEIVVSVNERISKVLGGGDILYFVCQSITMSRRSSKRVSPSKRR